MRSIKRGLRLVFTAAIVVTLALSAGAAGAAGGGKVVYNAVPNNMPGNVPSVGFEATGTDDFGDSVILAAGGRTAKSVDVVLSSWACESGHWTSADCVTSKGATFRHPITLTLYAVDSFGEPGALLLSDTQTFGIPFRPSTDARCGGGAWYSEADQTCYNGFAHEITFKLGGHVTLPDEVIWTVAYNTTHSGYDPIGDSTDCYATAQGCGYDSLNVGVRSFVGQPSKGTDANPDQVIRNSHTSNGWTGNRPLATIRTTGHGGGDAEE